MDISGKTAIVTGAASGIGLGIATARHFVPAILRHGEEGHVVNTASVAGFQNRRGTNQGPYSMSKYAAL
jgi:NAD(P)-dependent dehydrogenase (short-subunit alcohol dehydrogenase family)